MQAPTIEDLSKHWSPGEDITEQSHLHGFYEEFDSGGTKGIDPPKVINEVFPPGFEYGNYYKIYLVRGMFGKSRNDEKEAAAPKVQEGDPGDESEGV